MKKNKVFEEDEFYELFEIISQSSEKEYISNAKAIEIKVEDVVKTISELGEIDLDFEELRDNKIRILLNTIEGTQCYWNDDLFLAECNSLKIFNKNIIVFNIDTNSPRLFIKDKERYLLGFQDENDFFENVKAYLIFLDFLESEAKESQEKVFDFVDFYNKDFRKIIFTSPKTGKVIVKYNKGVPPVIFSKSYDYIIDRFIKCFSDQNRHLPKFLKTEILNTLRPIEAEKRMEALLSELDILIDSAEINFEVYLNDLSIENIKKEYEEYKHKYFEETSTVLGKVTNKIIGLPIAVSTTIFALSKVKDSNIGILLLIASIIIASYYIGVLLKLNIKDLKSITTSINDDYKLLLKSPFFVKYPKELTKFDESKRDLEVRIDLVISIARNYFWILFFSNLVIIVYALSNLIDSGSFLIILFCIGGIIIGLIQKYILDINE